MKLLFRLGLFLSLLSLSSCDRDRLIEVHWTIVNNSPGTINISSKLFSESVLEFNSIGRGTELFLYSEEWISEPEEVIETVDFVFEELIITNELGLQINKNVLDFNNWAGWEENENRVRFRLVVGFEDFE